MNQLAFGMRAGLVEVWCDRLLWHLSKAKIPTQLIKAMYIDRMALTKSGNKASSWSASIKECVKPAGCV